MKTALICLDASFVVRLLVEAPGSTEADALWNEWTSKGLRRFAPALLSFEVCNALYRYEHAGLMSPDDVADGLAIATSLPITIFDEASLSIEALRLARQFDLRATYDAHYLAVAHRLNAPLYTADKKLAQAVNQDWVHVIG
jgi:predicted nucleic acid-binding protein